MTYDAQEKRFPWRAYSWLLRAFGEILSSAGIWGLSYELADPRSAGAYQGLFAMAFSIGTMVTPAVIAVTVVDNGTAGWVVLGVIFLASSAGIRAIAHRAPSSA